MTYTLSQDEAFGEREMKGEMKCKEPSGEASEEIKREIGEIKNENKGKGEFKEVVKGGLKMICLEDFTVLENHTENIKVQISNALEVSMYMCNTIKILQAFASVTTEFPYTASR